MGLFLDLAPITPVLAFVTTRSLSAFRRFHQQRQQLTQQQASTRDGQAAAEDNVRDQLEKLLSLTPQQHHHTRGSDHHQEEAALLLTSHEEHVKEMELHLLDRLQESDEAIDPLVDLWMGEHGQEAAQAMHRMETECGGGPQGLEKEEAVLRSLIQIHQEQEEDIKNNGWVEPMSRLAVLLFVKGQYAEATEWCYRVLDKKPWHFETGQLLVALWLRRENLAMAVRVARQYTLPDLNQATNHKRRRAWVERNRSVLTDILQSSRRASEAFHHDESLFLEGEEECQDEYCWA